VQQLSLVPWNPPASLDANADRNEKAKVLATSPHPPRGLRARSSTKASPAERVAPDSQTRPPSRPQLYSQLRWKGEPFYLRPQGHASPPVRSSSSSGAADVMFGLAPPVLHPQHVSSAIHPRKASISASKQGADTVAESRTAKKDFS
jgi:hypothetical protein